MKRLSLSSPTVQTAMVLATLAVVVVLGSRFTGAQESRAAQLPPAALPLQFAKGERIALVGSSAAEFRAMLVEAIKKLGEIVKIAGIQPE